MKNWTKNENRAVLTSIFSIWKSSPLTTSSPIIWHLTIHISSMISAKCYTQQSSSPIWSLIQSRSCYGPYIVHTQCSKEQDHANTLICALDCWSNYLSTWMISVTVTFLLPLFFIVYGIACLPDLLWYAMIAFLSSCLSCRYYKVQ